MTAQTPAQRKAAERARKREAGLKKVEYWIKPKYQPLLDSYYTALTALDHYKQDSTGS